MLCHLHFGEWSYNSLRFVVPILLLQFVSFSSNKTLWSFQLRTKDQQSCACLLTGQQNAWSHWLKQDFSVEWGQFPKGQWPVPSAPYPKHTLSGPNSREKHYSITLHAAHFSVEETWAVPETALKQVGITSPLPGTSGNSHFFLVSTRLSWMVNEAPRGSFTCHWLFIPLFNFWWFSLKNNSIFKFNLISKNDQTVNLTFFI